MSDTTTPTQARARPEVLLIGLVVVIAIVILFVFSGQRQQVLRSSPTGFDGLQVWLATNDISAQAFTGGWTINEENIGRIVLPLYDTDLSASRPTPKSKEELLIQQDELDQVRSELLDRAWAVESLIILPKWRSGMRLTGLAHPQLLVEESRVSALYRDLMEQPRGFVTHIRQPFQEFTYETPGETLTAKLYVPQVFTDPNCDPIIADADKLVLASCPLPDSTFYTLVLSDPDLLNNHGLRLGDNAKIALDLFQADAELGQILIDYSKWSWLLAGESEVIRERTWDDLRRFFGPPFATLWIGAAIILALAIWRAGLRYGPIRRDGVKPGASKGLAISAQARLLRLTGQDGALLRDYAKTRLAAVAAIVFGPRHGKGGTDAQALQAHLKRQRPDLAQQLETVLDDIHALPAKTTAASAIAHVDALETLLERIANDT